MISTEQRREAFDKLSPEIKAFLCSDSFSETLKNIGSKHSLLLDKISGLEDEIFLAVMGLRSTTEFIENIVKTLELKQTTASKISEMVNDQVFVKIRSLIQNTPSEQEIIAGNISERKETDTREDILAEIENDVRPSPIEDTHKLLIPTAVSVSKTTLTELPKTEQKKEEKKYSIDPYREPIQ